MKSIDSNANCPGCNRPLAPGRSLGLCPRCLLARASLITDHGSADHSAESQSIPELSDVAVAFPQLEILGFLGRGGMGVVYKARQRSLDRIVALKLVAPKLDKDAQFSARFAKEAKALASLKHHGIVTIYDSGYAKNPDPSKGDGYYYLLMEFVDGVNLRQAMQAGRFTPEQALTIVPTVCDALHYAHENGIVHCDIKPENLLLDKTGHVKIVDFGIARMLSPVDGTLSREEVTSADRIAILTSHKPTSSPPNQSQVSDPMIAGTPAYMAPEQKLSSQNADHRADIYSLGVVLYEMLTGELPGKEFQPPSQKVEMDVRLDEVVVRALALQPELRFKTAAEFKTQLTEVLKAGSSHKRQTSSGTDRAATDVSIIRLSTGIIAKSDIFSTPHGQMWLPTYRSQILLDSKRLAYYGDSTKLENKEIALDTIQSIGIGEVSRTCNPIGLKMIVLEHMQDGKAEQSILAPMQSWFELPGSWNSRVLDWYRLLKESVRKSKGTEPRVLTTEELQMPIIPLSTSLIVSSIYIIPMLISVLLPLALLLPQLRGTTMLKNLPMIGAAVSMSVVLVALVFSGRQSSRRNEAMTSKHPNSWSFASGWLSLFLGATFLAAAIIFQVNQSKIEAARNQHEILQQNSQSIQLHNQIHAEEAKLSKEKDPSTVEQLKARIRFLTAQVHHIERLSASPLSTRGRQSLLPSYISGFLATLPLFLSSFILLRRPKVSSPEVTSPPRPWMKWSGIILLIPSVPLAVIAMWSALQVANDDAWNPGISEATFAIACWILAPVLLFLSFFCIGLSRARTVGISGKQKGIAIVVMAIGLISSVALHYLMFQIGHTTTNSSLPTQPTQITILTPQTSLTTWGSLIALTYIGLLVSSIMAIFSSVPGRRKLGIVGLVILIILASVFLA